MTYCNGPDEARTHVLLLKHNCVSDALANLATYWVIYITITIVINYIYNYSYIYIYIYI